MFRQEPRPKGVASYHTIEYGLYRSSLLTLLVRGLLEVCHIWNNINKICNMPLSSTFSVSQCKSF